MLINTLSILAFNCLTCFYATDTPHTWLGGEGISYGQIEYAQLASVDAESNASLDFKKSVQTHLQTLGYYRGPIDGIFGVGSNRALALFLQEAGLKNVLDETNYPVLLMSAEISASNVAGRRTAIKHAKNLTPVLDIFLKMRDAVQLGNVLESKKYFDKFFEIVHLELGIQNGDRLNMSRTALSMRIDTLLKLGLFRDAEALIIRLSAANRIINDPRSALFILHSRHTILEGTGQFSEALQIARISIEHSVRHTGKGSTAYFDSMSKLASTYFKIREYLAAIEIYEELLVNADFFNTDVIGHPNEGFFIKGARITRAHNSLQLAYLKSGQIEKALELGRPWVDSFTFMVGKGVPNSVAKNNAQKAFGHDLVSVNSINRVLLDAIHFIHSGDHSLGLENLSTALEFSEETFGKHHINSLEMLATIAMVHATLPDIGKPNVYWRMFFDRLPNYYSNLSRQHITANAISGFILEYTDWLWRRHASLGGAEAERQKLLEDGFTAAAWQSINSLVVDIEAAMRRFEASELSSRDALRDLQDAKRNLESLQVKYWDKEFQEDSHLAEEVLNARAKVNHLFDQFRADEPALAQMTFPIPPSSTAVASALRDGEALLMVNQLDESLDIWLLTINDLVWERIPISREKMSGLVNSIRAGVAPSTPRSNPVSTNCMYRSGDPHIDDIFQFDLCSSHDLFNHLFSSLNLDNIHSLIFVGDGDLQRIPLSLLVSDFSDDSVTWLIDDFALSSVPTIAAFRKFSGLNLRSRPVQLNSFLGLAPIDFSHRIGDADSRLGVQSLPSTEREVLSFASNFSPTLSKVLLRDAATEDWLQKSDLQGFDVVSFATHGLLASETRTLTSNQISESSLLLATSHGANDGILTSSEVALLRLDAELVVLSACNTATGEGVNSGNLSGLARSFLYAGARSILVSHWPVDDRATAALMANFVSSLNSQEKNFARALQSGVQELKANADYAHPYYWSAFDLVSVN